MGRGLETRGLGLGVQGTEARLRLESVKTMIGQEALLWVPQHVAHV